MFRIRGGEKKSNHLLKMKGRRIIYSGEKEADPLLGKGRVFEHQRGGNKKVPLLLKGEGVSELIRKGRGMGVRR